jgi:hypothetical protein
MPVSRLREAGKRLATSFSASAREGRSEKIMPKQKAKVKHRST